MTYTTREWNFYSNVEKEKDDIIDSTIHKKQQNNDNSRACPTKFSLSSPKRRRFNHPTHHKYKTTPHTNTQQKQNSQHNQSIKFQSQQTTAPYD
jgi:hypothetical protein